MRPADIPANPHKAYRGDPLVQFRWANFLGYRVGSRGLRRDFLSFFEARKIVRKLELKTQTQFQKWAKSENRPANIPANPERVYATNGWVSTSDWLGTTTLPFLEARAFARTLKLKGKKEWVGWKKSGKRPSNIPSNPDQAYRDTGWDSMQDWLGYGPWGGEPSEWSRAAGNPARAGRIARRGRRKESTPTPSYRTSPPSPLTSTT